MNRRRFQRMVVPAWTWSIRPSLIGISLIVALSCAPSVPPTVTPYLDSPAVTAVPALRSPALAPRLRVVFRQGKAFAQEGDHEWLISEVDQSEMLWAPDGRHFAYLKKGVSQDPPSPSLLPRSTASKKKAKFPLTPPPDTYHLVIRNIRGNSINEFTIYRPGRPQELDWIDNHRLAYLAPEDSSGDAYVVHNAITGDILQVWRGNRFIWSPGRRLLAYIQQAKNEEIVMISRCAIWPRSPLEQPALARERPPNKKSSRKVMGDLVWSPDGHGLAFIESVGRETRLVVLLVFDNPEGDLVWPLPKNALDPANRVFWADSKVVIGKSMLKPSFAASWTRLH